MADPNRFLELPNDSFAGAMYQPLTAWKLFYRYGGRHRDEPWTWPFRRMRFSDRELITRIRELQNGGPQIDPKVLAQWRDAADTWFPPAGPAVWGYVRVSHDSSAESGLSVENQLDDVREFHAKRFASLGFELGPILSDVDVGARFTPLRGRRGGRDLVRFVKPGDQVAFVTLDRGFRSMKDCLVLWEDHWQPQGIVPHFLQYGIDPTTVEGTMCLHACLMMSQAESSWKQRQSLRRAQWLRDHGKPRSRYAPLGHKIIVERDGSKHLLPDPQVRAVMRLIESLRDKGTPWVDIDLQMGKECRFIPWDQRGKYPSPLESRWYPAHMKSRRLYLAWQEIKKNEGTE